MGIIMDNNVIETTGLSIGYGSNIIAEDIDLVIKKAEIVSLIGPNGSGKSTLLKTLIKELAPIRGSVSFLGRPLKEYSAKELSQKTAILMTGRFRTGFMTCREIVEYGRYPYTGITGRLSDEDMAIVEAAMEELRIKALSDRLFANLSDGQKQLAMLARAVCQEPELLVMDEPTSFLDINFKLEFMKMIKKLSEKGVTVIMSLHELGLAREISDKAVCLKEGRVFKAGGSLEVFNREVITELFDIGDLGASMEEVFAL